MTKFTVEFVEFHSKQHLQRTTKQPGKVLCIPISMEFGKEHSLKQHAPDKVASTVRAALHHFGFTTVIIGFADTLQIHTHKITSPEANGTDPSDIRQSLIESANALQDTYKAEDSVMRQPEVRYQHWQDWTNDTQRESFQQKKAMIERRLIQEWHQLQSQHKGAPKKNKYQDWKDWIHSKTDISIPLTVSTDIVDEHRLLIPKINKIAGIFVGKLLSGGKTIDYPTAKSHCIDYIIEESAVACLWHDGGITHVAYPANNKGHKELYNYLRNMFGNSDSITVEATAAAIPALLSIKLKPQQRVRATHRQTQPSASFKGMFFPGGANNPPRGTLAETANVLTRVSQLTERGQAQFFRATFSLLDQLEADTQKPGNAHLHYDPTPSAAASYS